MSVGLKAYVVLSAVLLLWQFVAFERLRRIDPGDLCPAHRDFLEKIYGVPEGLRVASFLVAGAFWPVSAIVSFVKHRGGRSWFVACPLGCSFNGIAHRAHRKSNGR